MVLDFIEFAFATFKYKKEWRNYKVIPSFIRNILGKHWKGLVDVSDKHFIYKIGTGDTHTVIESVRET